MGYNFRIAPLASCINNDAGHGATAPHTIANRHADMGMSPSPAAAPPPPPPLAPPPTIQNTRSVHAVAMSASRGLKRAAATGARWGPSSSTGAPCEEELQWRRSYTSALCPVPLDPPPPEKRRKLPSGLNDTVRDTSGVVRVARAVADPLPHRLRPILCLIALAGRAVAVAAAVCGVP